MDETPEGFRRGEVQNSERVSADGAEAARKESLLHRERRAVTNIAELEKRLQAMEEGILSVSSIVSSIAKDSSRLLSNSSKIQSERFLMTCPVPLRVLFKTTFFGPK